MKIAKKIIVTGVNGFVGKHLARELAKNNISVTGVGREKEVDGSIDHCVSEYHSVDLTREWPNIESADSIIHLAGLASVSLSFQRPQDYIELNSAMFVNMAEFYLKKAQKPRIVVVSSGAVYDSDQKMPLNENSEIKMSSPYVVGKVLIENLCEYYRQRGLECIIARPFNHVGPGQLAGFLIPDIIQQLKSSDTAFVGNTSTKRDYSDVRDIARAYRLLATTPDLNYSTYNACSGKSISGDNIIKNLKAELNKPDAEIIVDKSKIRPTDPVNIYGDYSRLLADTGWHPEYNLKQTLKDTIKE